MLRTIEYREAEKLLTRRAARLTEAEGVVGPILEAVRRKGDKALLKYARKLDGLEPAWKSVEVPERQIQAFQVSLYPVFDLA